MPHSKLKTLGCHLCICCCLFGSFKERTGNWTKVVQLFPTSWCPLKYQTTAVCVCVHQRRQIDAVRTQRHSVVFVYQELGEPGSSPHSQTDSGSSSPCLFIIDQGDGCLPSGLRRGNFSPYLSFSLTSLSPSLPLFAQHLNVLVQTLFSPAGREVPYAHPVKAAVVMDTGKHQEIKQALDSAGRSVTLYLKGFFFLHRTPRPSLSSSPTDETPVCYCVVYIALFILLLSPCVRALRLTATVFTELLFTSVSGSTYNSRKSGKSCFPLNACISIPVDTWGTSFQRTWNQSDTYNVKCFSTTTKKDYNVFWRKNGRPCKSC